MTTQQAGQFRHPHQPGSGLAKLKGGGGISCFGFRIRKEVQQYPAPIHVLNEAGFAESGFQLGAQMSDVGPHRSQTSSSFVAPDFPEGSARFLARHAVGVGAGNATDWNSERSEPHRFVEPDGLKAPRTKA